MTSSPFVSTGRLPAATRVQELVTAAYERFRSNDEGAVSTVYPALAGGSADLLGVCVGATSGALYTAGDAEHEFTIMSVAKPFTFALVCQAVGAEELRAKVGVNATGRPFNSLEGIAESADGRTNPMVNPGAIATASLVPGRTADEKWRFLQDGLSRFAGRELPLDDDVYESASRDKPREPRPRSSPRDARAHLLGTRPRPSTSTRDRAPSASARATCP